MNPYASGGFNYLAESGDAALASPDEFIRYFVGLIVESVDADSQAKHEDTF